MYFHHARRINDLQLEIQNLQLKNAELEQTISSHPAEKYIYEAHLQNYRLAFDAMRAYHTSEIEHKKDMTTMYNNIFISLITVFAGIFYFILSPEYSAYRPVSILIIILIGGLYINLIYRLMEGSISKVKRDNSRYEKFRTECNIEREYLLLNDFYRQQKQTDHIYWNPAENKDKKDEDRPNTGYIETIGIMRIYGWGLLYIVVSMCLVSIVLILNEILQPFFRFLHLCFFS